MVFMPTTKIKDIICTQGQDKVPEEDKAGVVYMTDCMIHTDCYVGQTGKPNKERSYQHGIITHAEATTTKAIEFDDLTKQREPAPWNLNLRRSERQRNRPDYAKMHTGGGQKLSPGNSAVSQHMAEEEHDPGDMMVKILCREPNRWKRWVKESIWIHRTQPSLNRTNLEDQFNLPKIWHNLIDDENI